MVKEINLNINSLVSGLANIISCGKNSVYKNQDIAYRTLQSAVHNQSLEAMYKLTHNLSADRVLDKLHGISKEDILGLQTTCTKQIKLQKGVVMAIDFSDKIYYGDRNHPDAVGSKGGSYARRYIESSIVKPALFLNALPVNQFTNDKESLLTELLDRFYSRYNKTKIDLLLIDRGFFSKKVVKLLVELGISFIMPAIKNPAIKKLVEKFKHGEIKSRYKYKFGEVKVWLTFLKVEDEIFVYMSNTKKSPLKVHLLYKKRWQIETNFREQNNFTFKTTTRDFNLRYLAFVLGGLLLNAWQLTRNKLKYSLESYLFKQYLLEEILYLWQTISKKDVVKSMDYFLVA